MFYDERHNVLVYDKLPPIKEQQFFRYVQEARQLHNGYVACLATLANLQILRCLELPVAPPLTDRTYNWPRNYVQVPQPFDSQKVRSNFLVCNPRALDLSDPGTGKTLASLWAADALMDKHPPGTFRALVVAPLSTLQDTWADAIFQHFMGKRTCVVLHGSAKKRSRLLAEQHDFYIINHDGVGVGARLRKRQLVLEGFVKQLSERTDIRLAIVDEISGYRDHTTNRSRIARRVLATRDYFWGLTGTPTSGGPDDAYGIAKLLNDAKGETKASFKGRTMFQVGMYKWVPRAGANEVVAKVLTPAIRYALEDCVDLPEMTYQTRHAELTAAQKKAMVDFKRDMLLMMQSGEKITAANEAVLRHKFIQLACGEVYDQNHKAHHIDCGPRMAVLQEALDEDAGKILVFAPLTSVINMIKVTLKKQSIAVVNGHVPPNQRNDIFRMFRQEREPRIILADPTSMQHGLNLAVGGKCHTIIWYAPVDKTETWLQANRRIRRPDQKEVQRIIRIAAHPIEREMYRRAETNESFQGLMLKMMEGGQ